MSMKTSLKRRTANFRLITTYNYLFSNVSSLMFFSLLESIQHVSIHTSSVHCIMFFDIKTSNDLILFNCAHDIDPPVAKELLHSHEGEV